MTNAAFAASVRLRPGHNLVCTRARPWLYPVPLTQGRQHAFAASERCLRPVAVLNTLYAVVGHLALDHPGVGTQAPSREGSAGNLSDGAPMGQRQVVRGKKNWRA